MIPKNQNQIKNGFVCTQKERYNLHYMFLLLVSGCLFRSFGDDRPIGKNWKAAAGGIIPADLFGEMPRMQSMHKGSGGGAAGGAGCSSVVLYGLEVHVRRQALFAQWNPGSWLIMPTSFLTIKDLSIIVHHHRYNDNNNKY